MYNILQYQHVPRILLCDEQSQRTVTKSVGSAIALVLLATQLACFVQAEDVHVDNSFTNISNNSDFICQSQDLQVASNFPFDNFSQTCGNQNHFYVYNGAFSNRSLNVDKSESITFNIHIRKMETALTLFEFGMSNGSVSRMRLRGPPSREYFGWVLTQLGNNTNYSLVNTNWDILQSDISIIFNVSFKFKVELLRNRSVALQFFYDSNNVFEYIEHDMLHFRNNELFFFLKLAQSFEAEQTVSIISKHLSFDRCTLYPGMYISENNKQVSNKPSAGLTEKHEEKTQFVDIILQNCDQRCTYVLEFRVRHPRPSKVLSLYLMKSWYLSLNHFYNLLVFSYVVVDSPVKTVFYSSPHHKSPHPGDWETIIIIVDRKLKFISFHLSNVVFMTKNEHFIDRDDPVLRWVVHDINAEFIIKRGDRDQYSICSWMLTYFSKQLFDSQDGKVSCVNIPNIDIIIISAIFVVLILQCCRYCR